MKTVIDELSLKIDVKVKKDIDKTISSLATSINKLNKAVSSVSALKKYVNTLNKMSGKSIKITGQTGVAKTAKNVPVETQEVNVKGAETQSVVATQKSTQAKEKNLEVTRQQIEAEKEKQKQSKKTEQEEDKNSKKSQGRLSKIFKSLGRIALYRAARTVIKELVQSATEGLANIRSVDAELDLSMKKVSQSFTSIKNSIGSLLSGVIKSVEPIITKIADTIANITNRINEAKAALSGQTKYTKILTSDSEEYKKNLEEATGTLLDFDKFSALDKDKQGYTGVVEADVGMSKETAQATINNLKLVETGLLAIGFAIAAIQALKFVNTITNITNKLKDMVVGSKKATDALNTQKSASKALATTGILALSTGIITLIANWNDMSSTARVLVPVLSILAGVVTALAVAFTVAKGNWLKAISIGAIVTGSGLAVGATLSAQKYANGGTPQTGTLFYAGEAGAEIVANTSTGRTGVTNIAQFKTAMVQALAEYGVAQRGSNADMVLQVNGREFARATASDMAGALSNKYRVDFRPR